jgi:predicted acylesterase/phospholipase RssA
MNTIISEYDTLVVSGGAINGISILGGLQYLKDNNMINSIKTYVGTSVGVIICYLLIIGYTPIEIIVYLCTNNHIFEKMKFFDLVNAARGEGATTFIHISEQLEKMTIEKIGRLLTLKDIEQNYKKKLICITYNITKNSIEYLTHETNPDLPCLIAIRMSCNLPLVFESFKYENNFYIDGGVVNNFPIDVGEKEGEKIIAIGLEFYMMEDNPALNVLEYIYKLLYIPIQQSVNINIKNKRETTTVINLRSNKDIKFFNFDITSKIKLELFSKGYEDVKNFYN